MLASTCAFPLGYWMCTQVSLLNSECTNTAWNMLARFIAHGEIESILNAFHLLTSLVTCTGKDGALEEYIVVSIYKSNTTINGGTYGRVIGPAHEKDRCQDVLLRLVQFLCPKAPITPSMHVVKRSNATTGHLFTQASMSARNLMEAGNGLLPKKADAIHAGKQGH